MFQAGRFGSGDIRASRLVIEGSHLLADAVNAMFQSGTYFGRARLLGPCNSIRFEPSVTFAPACQVLVSAGWGFYWRQSVYDALYSISGQVIVPSNGTTDRRAAHGLRGSSSREH